MPQGLALTAKGLVVTAGRGAVELRALGGGGCVAIAAPGLYAFVIAGEDLWIAADGPILARYDLRGLRIGEPIAVSPPRDDCALLGGAPGVAWLGAPVQLIKAAADGLHVETVADADLAMAVTQSRRLVAGRGTLSLHELYEIRWSIPLGPGARARDAALVLDGRAVAVVVASTAAQAILVVGLRDGAVLHRVAVPPNAHVRLAPQRGVALIHHPPARLVLVDLRFGRVLFEHDEQRSLAEVAIDPTGSLAALRLADGELVGVAVRDLAAYARTPVPASAPLATVERSAALNDNGAPAVNGSDRSVHAGSGPDGDDAADAHPPAAASDPFACDATITAFACLAPRRTIEPLTREESREAARYERDLAYARVMLAVARSWDTGKLAYPNTGRLPFHSELSGGLGGGGNLAPSEVADASVRFAGALAACAAFAARSSPRRAPIDRLATESSLSPLACDIVRTIAAPLVWGDLARPYGILANDEARPLCDEVLLGQILADEDSRAIAVELDPEARLITTGIVRVGTGRVRPFLPLVVDPIVLRLLRDAELDGELAPVIRVRTADRTFAELCIPGPTKAVLIEQLRTAPAPLRLVVRGRTGSGRHALLAAVAAEAGRSLAQIDASDTARDPMRTGELRTALERAHLAGHLPCIDGLDALADDPERRHVQAVIDAHHGPLAVRLAWDTRPPLTPGYTLCDLPPLAAADRILAWRGALARHDLAARELDSLVERYTIGPGIAELVARTVAASPPPGDAGAALEIAVRQHLANRLGSTADRVLRLASWSQIVLPADIQDSLVELMARIKHRRTVFEQWGFDRVATNARGVTALFQGAPGTGKTLVATAIANELGMDLYRVDLSRIMSKWIGETEQNLARLFDAAEDGNTIVLFDEADSLFAKRTEVRTSVDRYANLEVNYLLQRIDRFEGIAILTTNFGTSIDSAFKRRLSMRLTFPFPDEEMREKLWEAHLPPELPRAGALDLAMLAQCYQLSGGYIRNCAMRAAFLAAEEHAPLSAEHLDRAVRAEFREIGKLADTGTLE